MAQGSIARRLPGGIAMVLAIVTATFALTTATTSMLYDTWGQPFPAPLVPLVSPIIFFLLCIVATRRPAAGGLLILAYSIVSGVIWSQREMIKSQPFSIVIMTLMMIYGPTAVTAIFFLIEARARRAMSAAGVQPPAGRLARSYRLLLVAGMPLVIYAIFLAMKLPPYLARLDDGLRGARAIEGNGVALVWAPQGPGWNWKQPNGRYPSWDMIARYGVEPVGLEGKNAAEGPHATAAGMDSTCLCAYLNEDGTALLPAPAFIWRMPTADEIVRSLTRGGENAGCAWDGKAFHAECRVPPDKETPLWAPDEAPIYYWASEEYDSLGGRCVNYTGGVNMQPKWRMSEATGYRCVKTIERPAATP